jgi:hypothetical protein
MKSGARLGGTFFVESYDKHGTKKWEDVAHNTVVNVGLQHILNTVFTGAGSTQVSPWYMGLLASTVVTGDRTMANISQATECSNVTRPAYVETRTNQTLSNTLAKSTFTLDKDATTVEGAFLCSSNDIDGTAGILMCAAPFAGGTKVGDSGDKIIVTYTFVASDDTSS